MGFILKIWGRKNSMNVQKVMWAVGELGLAHERIDAGRGFGKNDTPEYLRLNPNGLIPTLEDGDVVQVGRVRMRFHDKPPGSPTA